MGLGGLQRQHNPKSRTARLAVEFDRAAVVVDDLGYQGKTQASSGRLVGHEGVKKVVSVRDNGRGVSEEIRAHLFDAFVTNKPTGTGLGLALVAKIINDHGGAIEFESEPGRTTFRVMLPLQSLQAHS